jgi:hypothetical protein
MSLPKQPPICPVCGIPLRPTGNNPDMYYCTKRKIWIQDLGMHLDIIDATIYVSPDGKPTLKIIEIPPYSFTITDDPGKTSTVIRKVMPQERLPGARKARTLERKIILSMDVVAKLPWHDREKVLERVKLYLLFS